MKHQPKSMCGARHLMNITSIVPLPLPLTGNRGSSSKSQSAALLQLKAGTYGLTPRLQALPFTTPLEASGTLLLHFDVLVEQVCSTSVRHHRTALSGPPILSCLAALIFVLKIVPLPGTVANHYLWSAPSSCTFSFSLRGHLHVRGLPAGFQVAVFGSKHDRGHKWHRFITFPFKFTHVFQYTECRDIVFSPDSLKVTLGVSGRRVILDRCCLLFMWSFGCWGCLLFVLRCLPSAFPGCSGLWFEMSRSPSHRMYGIEPAIQEEVRPSFDQGILGDRAGVRPPAKSSLYRLACGRWSRVRRKTPYHLT